MDRGRGHPIFFFYDAHKCENEQRTLCITRLIINIQTVSHTTIYMGNGLMQELLAQDRTSGRYSSNITFRVFSDKINTEETWGT